MNRNFYEQVAGGFGAVASAFVMESLESIIPWLIGMFFVILCDLFAGVWCCMKTGVRLRFSKGCRDTIAKCVTYFAAVVASCMIETAARTDWPIAKVVLLLVCGIELSSILANILRPKGYRLDLGKALKLLLGKLTSWDVDGVIVAAEEPKEEGAEGTGAETQPVGESADDDVGCVIKERR